MYESFYLRAVSPREPVGAWIRYTVEKQGGLRARGSLWVSVFDGHAGAPFMYRQSSDDLVLPAGGWIGLGDDSRFGPGVAVGRCGPARWSLRFAGEEPELRHFKQPWLYRTPLPRTKPTSPLPAARFDGKIELPGRTLQVDGWRGMVGHNWGSEHAARWIWLHGIDFREDANAWLDVALGRVLLAGRLTPWVANGAICIDGRRLRLGGLGARGLKVAESPARCSLSLPGERGLLVEAHVDTVPNCIARWRYSDPRDRPDTGDAGLDTAANSKHDGELDTASGGEHDVSNCSVAALALNVRAPGEAAIALHSAHGGAYELGVSRL
jgi:hypothetical protein